MNMILGIGVSFIGGLLFFNRKKLHGPNSNVEKNIIKFDNDKKQFYYMEPIVHICPSHKRKTLKSV